MGKVLVPSYNGEWITQRGSRQFLCAMIEHNHCVNRRLELDLRCMESPVSVTIANLVMEDLEERALATTDIPLRSWKHYVDDTCAALPVSRVQEFLTHLNRVEPSIQFTVKVESEGKLPFLDILYTPAGPRWLHLNNCIQESHPH